MKAASRSAGERDHVRAANSHVLCAPSHGDDHYLLDALPIAAGIFCMNGGRLWVQSLNQRFFELAGCEGSPDAFADLFKRYSEGPGGDFIRNFLSEPAEAADELDLIEGDGVGRRFLKLKLAPLVPGAAGEQRCLLSVVDPTIQVQSGHSPRAEMLRDSLTGLPNRLAFTEFVEKAGEGAAPEPKQADQDAAHAVLVVDMLPFSRINESMGSPAGHELQITVARRLISALRGGDPLAPNGGNEFGVLVSLRRAI